MTLPTPSEDPGASVRRDLEQLVARKVAVEREIAARRPLAFTFTLPQLVVGTFLFGLGWGIAESLIRAIS